MGLLRNKGFVAAVALCAVVALYGGLVASQAIVFIRTGEPVAVALGAALLVMPFIGAWWMISEWRLAATVQRMANILESQGQLPIHDGERDDAGRLSAAAQEAIFETARRDVETDPDRWQGWFHVGFAYDAARDRTMARRSLRHAATLFRTQRRDDKHGTGQGAAVTNTAD